MDSWVLLFFFLDQENVQFVDHSKLEYLPDYGCQL